MINTVNDVSVSVELSPFSDEDGRILRGQCSSKEVGALRSSVNWRQDVSLRNLTKSRSVQDFVSYWDFIFIASSALSVFVDPLICYAPVFDNDRNCFYRNQNLIWICLGLRTFGDVFYAIDAALFLSQSPRNDGNNKKIIFHYSFDSWTTLLVPERFPKISQYLKRDKSLKLFLALPRICAALPILEAMILVGKYTDKNGVYNNFFYVIPIQYVLRDYNLYLLLDHHAGIKTGIGRFLKSLLDLLPFILAAHLFGALWYFLAVDRKLACWQEHLCKNNRICTGRSIHSFFHCGERTDGNNKMFNATLLHNACAAQVSETVTKLHWDYGIYQYALQSDLTTSKNLPRKFLQSLWWGLRNLSSFGSNLNTSFSTNEILFSVLLSISGLTLFLIYLNSRVQGSQKISEQKKEREEEEKLREEEEKLREKIRTVYPSITQINEQMRNMWDLSLASVKKVERLANMDDKVLRAICKHMKQMVYNENMHIIREGEPLGMMLFLRQGIALTYTTNNGTRTSICECLKKSDFYGEELIDWAFRYASFSEIPILTRTVWSQTKVKAFTISADHLNSVVAEYWWYFKTDLARSQLEIFAASSLQTAWRRYSIRKSMAQQIWKKNKISE